MPSLQVGDLLLSCEEGRLTCSRGTEEVGACPIPAEEGLLVFGDVRIYLSRAALDDLLGVASKKRLR
jgi:hypothetical protein